MGRRYQGCLTALQLHWGTPMIDTHTKPQPVIITEEEAASLLRVKLFTMRKWRREGGGPPYIRCGGRLIRYIKNDVMGWLADNKFGSNAHELSAKITG